MVLFLNAFISSVELQVVIIIKEIKISFYLHLRPFSKIKQRLFSEILPAKTNDECKYVLGAMHQRTHSEALENMKAPFVSPRSMSSKCSFYCMFIGYLQVSAILYSGVCMQLIFLLCQKFFLG